jgi:hypothetical protein
LSGLGSFGAGAGAHGVPAGPPEPVMLLSSGSFGRAARTGLSAEQAESGWLACNSSEQMKVAGSSSCARLIRWSSVPNCGL